jgi:DNA-binding MarR family transcriptional regulator
MRSRAKSGAALPEMECACATVRRAARLVTQLYDEELRPHLQASQFALLLALEMRPGCNQSALARALAFDKTTISRNLGLMEKNGWIEYAAAGDRRERGFRLTASGRKLLVAARPGWQRAQNRLRSAMAGEQWEAMWRAFRNLTNAAHHARNQKGDTS